MERRKIQLEADFLDEQLYKEKWSSYLGRAKISLGSLQFAATHARNKQFSHSKVIKNLVRNFSREGCRRLDEENHVSALISDQVLTETLNRANLTPEQFRNTPMPPVLTIPSNIQLICLYGRHRLQAAGRLLDHGNDWWVVDLYEESEY
jgi:hypothetical protein